MRPVPRGDPRQPGGPALSGTTVAPTDDADWPADRLAARIQHTLIRSDATRDDVVAHCRECLEFGFDAAMVSGNWLPVARDVVGGTAVKLASAVDFPLGIMSTAGKVAEASALVAAGASELDVMVNIGWLRSGLDRAFREDVAAVVAAAGPAIVKVMLELPLLTPAERDRAVDLAVEAGVAYLKNGSSSAVGIATPAQIRYLRERAPASVRIKASGGIKDRQHAIALLEAGADLVGSSAGIALLSRSSGADSY